MFKKISKFIGSITDTDVDDFEDEYDDIEDDVTENPKIRQNKRQADYDDDYEDEEEFTPSFFDRKKKASKEDTKVIPIRKSLKPGFEVCVMMPKGFDEVEDICDKLLGGSIVALNIEALDAGEAQRIIDFAFGTMHAINGKFRAVSKYVYIISPENVELSVENEEEIMDTLFEVPKINVQ